MKRSFEQLHPTNPAEIAANGATSQIEAKQAKVEGYLSGKRGTYPTETSSLTEYLRDMARVGFDRSAHTLLDELVGPIV